MNEGGVGAYLNRDRTELQVERQFSILKTKISLEMVTPNTAQFHVPLQFFSSSPALKNENWKAPPAKENVIFYLKL